MSYDNRKYEGSSVIVRMSDCSSSLSVRLPPALRYSVLYKFLPERDLGN